MNHENSDYHRALCTKQFQIRLSNKYNSTLSHFKRNSQHNLKFPSLDDVLEQGEAFGILQMCSYYCWLPIEAALKLFFAERDHQAELASQKACLEQSEFTINITFMKTSIKDILIVQYMQQYIY
ncbi:Pseudouridine synthase family protein [Trifolium repens]|jgi:hypothetical protein|nr:Pseudouridine synthase family protein [Trifolium repens]